MTVLCARFGPGSGGLAQECVDLAAGAGAVVTRRTDGLVVAVFGGSGGADGTDLALAATLAVRRLSRAAGVAAPAIAVAGGRIDVPDGAWSAADPVDRVLQLVRRTTPGGVSLG